MFDRKGGGAIEIARLKGGGDLAVTFVRLPGVEIRLALQGNEDGAGGEIAQDVDQHLVAREFGDADMEITHQVGQPLTVSPCDRCPLFVEMGLEDLTVPRREFGQLADHAGFQGAPRSIDHDGFGGRRLDDEPPPSRADLDDASGLETHQGFANERAGDGENRGQLAFAQPCSRLDPSGEDSGDDRFFYGDFFVGLILHTSYECKACAIFHLHEKQRILDICHDETAHFFCILLAPPNFWSVEPASAA